MPEVALLTELIAMVDPWDQDAEARRPRGRTCTVGDYFAQGQDLLRPLPTEQFEMGRWSPRIGAVLQGRRTGGRSSRVSSGVLKEWNRCCCADTCCCGLPIA